MTTMITTTAGGFDYADAHDDVLTVNAPDANGVVRVTCGGVVDVYSDDEDGLTGAVTVDLPRDVVVHLIAALADGLGGNST